MAKCSFCETEGRAVSCRSARESAHVPTWTSPRKPGRPWPWQVGSLFLGPMSSLGGRGGKVKKKKKSLEVFNLLWFMSHDGEKDFEIFL